MLLKLHFIKKKENMKPDKAEKSYTNLWITYKMVSIKEIYSYELMHSTNTTTLAKFFKKLQNEFGRLRVPGS